MPKFGFPFRNQEMPEVNADLTYKLDDAKLIIENKSFDFKIKLAQFPSENYKLLFTSGLAKKEQLLEKKYIEFKHIELYMCLPDYWDLEKDSWPIDYLGRIAESHQKNQTWFTPGDTISTGNKINSENEKVLDSTLEESKYFMIIEPILMSRLSEIKSDDKSSFKYLAVFPIFKLEYEYKMRNSSTVLLSKIEAKGHTEKFDSYRQSVCRKRLLGMI